MLRCLQIDLEVLGCTTAAPPIAPREMASPAMGLGIAYVVRGSRLGAAVSRRGIFGDLPTLYLDFVPALSWTEFLIQLETIAGDPNATDVAIRAARRAFSIFITEFTRLGAITSTAPK
jgi:heme oxygenase